MITLHKRHIAYLSACILLYSVFVALYAGWSYLSAEKEIYTEIDRQLRIGASNIQYMLPDDFQDRALDKDSISREEELKLRKIFSEYALANNFAYLYTLVEKDGRFYFAASTVTEEQARERKSWYFYPYDDIPKEFVSAYRNQAITFATYTDRWGTFRSVALPQRSPGGKLYLACVDYDIAHLRSRVVQQTIIAALTALAFLLLLLPFILTYRSIQVAHSRQLLNEILEHRETEAQLLRVRTQLEARVDQRTSELKDANEELRKEIEERKRANESLAKAHDILNHSPVVGLLLENRNGWPVEYVTENVEAVFGYSDKAFTSGKVDFLSLILPEDRNRVFRELGDACLAPGKTYNHEPYRIVTKDGEERWVADSKSCVTDSQGQVTHYQAIIADITDRKRLQEWVEQTKWIEGLGRVAGGVAHDFNNILAGMVGNVELALAKIPETSEIRYYLEQLNELCQRAAALVKPMLDFSGKTRPLEDNINLSKLVRDFSDLLKSSVSKKAAITEVLADPIPRIKGNPGQLRDVIINLVTNASEALGDEPGLIRLSTSVVHADEAYLKGTYLYEQQPEGDYVCLDVSDTGEGMTEDVLGKIFNPFFSTRFIGRGLGLASVLGIVRSHHGAIKVESAPGQGSKFRVLFPAASPDQESESEEPEKITREISGPIQVLVADDEPSILGMLTDMLESLGYRVLSAADGAEALNLFQQHSDEIDLVILDRTMPIMSGEEAFTEITRINKDLPFIFTSGYSQLDLPESITERKNVVFIQKPFRLNVLQDTIQAFFPNS